MKILRTLSILLLTLILFSCSSDDDNNGQQQSTQELLTSGRWYQESRTPGSYTDCEKMGYIQFFDNGNLSIESFEGTTGNCESLGISTATFTLTNNVNITISFEGDTLTSEIVSITENLLTITTDNETITFDKTEG